MPGRSQARNPDTGDCGGGQVGLTSPVLSYLLAVLSAGLLLALMIGWRRLAGPGVRAIALRTAALVTGAGSPAAGCGGSPRGQRSCAPCSSAC